MIELATVKPFVSDSAWLIYQTITVKRETTTKELRSRRHKLQHIAERRPEGQYPQHPIQFHSAYQQAHGVEGNLVLRCPQFFHYVVEIISCMMSWANLKINACMQLQTYVVLDGACVEPSLLARD